MLALQEQFSRELAERMRAAADIQADWAARLDACVRAGFECYRELHDLHEVLFHHGHTAPGPIPSPRRPTRGHPGTARGRHGRGRVGRARPGIHRGAVLREHARLRPGFRGRGGPDDTRLIRAARQLFRRAAGVADRAGQPWPDRAAQEWSSAGRRRLLNDAPANPERPVKKPLRVHSGRPGWPIITNLLPNTG